MSVNNFSGIYYRLWGVCGIILFIGVMLLLFKKPWSESFEMKKCKIEIVMIAFAVCLALVYVSRIVFPKVSSYTGVFVETHRNSRVAPPLPLTYEYVFWNGDGKKKVVYLDILSKKEIIPFEFEVGQEYTLYYDEFTKVITRVQSSRKTQGDGSLS